MPRNIGRFMALLALVSAGGCAAPLAMAPPPARDPASAQAEEAPLVPRPDLVTGEKVIVQLNRPLEETPVPAGHHHHHGGATEQAETPGDDAGAAPARPDAGGTHDHHHHDDAAPGTQR
ncbi:MAG TPA: hypothetical protein VH877_30550 [Polyangia bacterium]|jgi:hypothetical protein|nr:hypothetical protein [Polyangia bacterium]